MSDISDGSYFPLIEFDWTGKQFEITPSTRIVSGEGIVHALETRFRPHGSTFQCMIGYDRYKRIVGTKYWLGIDASISPEEAENTAALFLWSLWLAASTRVRIRDQFNIRSDGFTPAWWTSTYEFNRMSPVENITIEVLNDVGWALPKIMSIYSKRDNLPRLSEAAFLTHLGCKNKNWQSSFILWMASLETLVLEPRDQKGYTFTVCSRTARLLSGSKSEYGAYYTEMKELYSIRSDIVHGKFGARAWDTNNPDDRLRQLARLETVLKSVWRKVLAFHNVEGIFEKTSDRDVFFNQTLA